MLNMVAPRKETQTNNWAVLYLYLSYIGSKDTVPILVAGR